jgi:hypothetical protein
VRLSTKTAGRVEAGEDADDETLPQLHDGSYSELFQSENLDFEEYFNF